MYKKIRIIGGSGSGKSTLASLISKQYHIPMYDLDDILRANKYEKKRNREERESLLLNLIKINAWIIEGVSVSQWTNKSLKDSDLIVYCYAPYYKIITRLLSREIRKGNSIKNIRGLIQYGLSYEESTPEIKNILIDHKDKIIFLKTSKQDIEKFMKYLAEKQQELEEQEKKPE